MAHRRKMLREIYGPGIFRKMRNRVDGDEMPEGEDILALEGQSTPELAAPQVPEVASPVSSAPEEQAAVTQA